MVHFKKKLTKAQLTQRVRDDWALYRLVFSGIDYNTVFYEMSPLEVELANVALDIKNAQDESALKKGR